MNLAESFKSISGTSPAKLSQFSSPNAKNPSNYEQSAHGMVEMRNSSEFTPKPASNSTKSPTKRPNLEYPASNQQP